GARSDQPTGALDDGDAAAAHQAAQTLVQPRDDAVLVGVQRGDVDAVEGGPDAELGAVARGVGDLGGVEQGLGRDAADVQAGAAELVLLDQGDAEPELGGMQGAGIAAAARSQDDDVVRLVLPGVVVHVTLLPHGAIFALP